MTFEKYVSDNITMIVEETVMNYYGCELSEDGKGKLQISDDGNGRRDFETIAEFFDCIRCDICNEELYMKNNKIDVSVVLSHYNEHHKD